MVAKEKVDVALQTIFVILPIVEFWAYYRIEKLRLGILLFVGLIGISIGIIIGLQFFLPAPYVVVAYAGMYIPRIIVPIIAIRKWSKKWNEEISEEILDSQESEKPVVKDRKNFFGIAWLFVLGILIIIIGVWFYFELQNFIDECQKVIDHTDNDILLRLEISCQWINDLQMGMIVLSIVGVIFTILGIIIKPKNNS